MLLINRTIMVIALLLGSCTSTQTVPSAATKTVDDKPIHDRPLLWEVKKPNYPTSYLFGTIHLGFRLQDLATIVTDKLDTCGQVVLEVDVQSIDASAIASAHYSKKGTLKRALKASEWQKLQGMVPQVRAEDLQKLSPYGAISLIEKIGFNLTQIPMDLEIHNRSKKLSKPLIFLETPQFQLDLLKQIMTLTTLKAMLRSKVSPSSGLAKMQELYWNGDVDALYEFIRTPTSGVLTIGKADLRKLLDDRNRTWSTILDPIFRRDRSFVAVGAGHLGGPMGLLSLLTKRGFILERISSHKISTKVNKG